jgi:hypothetical protein
MHRQLHLAVVGKVGGGVMEEGNPSATTAAGGRVRKPTKPVSTTNSMVTSGRPASRNVTGTSA